MRTLSPEPESRGGQPHIRERDDVTDPAGTGQGTSPDRVGTPGPRFRGVDPDETNPRNV